MSRWSIKIELYGSPTEGERAAIRAEVNTAHFDLASHVVTIRLTVDTPTPARPLTAVEEHLELLPTIQRLIAQGDLTNPYHYQIQTQDAEDRALAILSTNGVAHRLNLSEARVRQLKVFDPMFPKPHEVPGAAGDFYRTADIDLYSGQRRTGGAAGRPQADDEQRLDAALRTVIANSTIDKVARAELENALKVQGGRYLRGKAYRLVMLPQDRIQEVTKALDGEERQTFLDAIERAVTIWN